MESIEEDFEEGIWPFGGEGDADEVHVPTGSSCVKISEMLGSADELAGEYSFGGVATTLPVAPGISIDGVGMISVPLVPEQAEKLIAKCEKSPFGHNMDTKLDDEVRMSWQLAPDQVQISNSQWAPGLEDLMEVIAQRLGYEKIPLQCMLYKLLVYGEGGHFLKHQDTEKEDGMVATLVIQPPSTHEGGDLVVYRGGKPRYRHTFGKEDDTAAYKAHYAVHYADAEHSLETVTKGYRLALVYSICLPPVMRHLKRNSGMPMSDDLAHAVSEMGNEDESFALLLSHEYTKKSIGRSGCGVLKGVDSARFCALEEANAVVPVDKKLRFFVAEVSHEIISCPTSTMEWQEQDRNQAIHWYSTTGEDLGLCRDPNHKEKLNFLNPGGETFRQLWELHGNSSEQPYTGNEGPTQNTKYSRFAIVAWPATKHLENALKVMSVELSVEALMDRRPVDASTLRKFLDEASKRIGGGKQFGGDKASVRFCGVFCELLVDAGDSELAKDFFAQYCPLLGELRGNATLIPVITKVVRALDWNILGDAILEVLGNKTREYDEEEDVGDTELEMTLQVVDTLDEGVAQEVLLKMAVQLALKLDEKINKRDDDENGDFNMSKVAGIFWKHVIHSADQSTFDTVAEHFSNKDPSELGSSIEVFSQFTSDLDEAGAKFTALTGIVASRMKWLKREIKELDTTFSWEMSYAVFPDNKLIENFLRGPESSMKTTGLMTFTGLPEARMYANKYKVNQYESSFTMKPAGKGKNAYVTLQKTKKWFNNCQKVLVQHKAEMEELGKRYGGASGGRAKKTRVE